VNNTQRINTPQTLSISVSWDILVAFYFPFGPPFIMFLSLTLILFAASAPPASAFTGTKYIFSLSVPAPAFSML
jgi:hypothetical protein